MLVNSGRYVLLSKNTSGLVDTSKRGFSQIASSSDGNLSDFTHTLPTEKQALGTNRPEWADNKWRMVTPLP